MPSSSGKHMICDIKDINNTQLLNSVEGLKTMLDIICTSYDFTVLHRIQHRFSPHGITILYMLSESHISIHTFPEHKYLALDIYTCRQYEDNEIYYEIYNYLIDELDAFYDQPVIIDRVYDLPS